VTAFVLHRGDAAGAYAGWPAPDLIVSDGAYGLGGFHGDPRSPSGLPAWYGGHVAAWSRRARPSTTLWFWNSEIGWATVHPLLVEHGWEYVQTIVWDKGVGHVAGNVNGSTIRQFPVVTEVCVFYRRALRFESGGAQLPAREWLRAEWTRAGLPLRLANEACGVRNAATRKYLTQDWVWYFPPAEMMARLVACANQRGRPAGRPYYSLDGERPVSPEEWARLRHTWAHQHGVTNVWVHPPLAGVERFRGDGRRSAPRVYRPGPQASLHLNQKPLAFMERILAAATLEGDVVWEPFGGLCSAAVASVAGGRLACCAEIDEAFAAIAADRLAEAARSGGAGGAIRARAGPGRAAPRTG
jgi:DNA methylase